MRDRIPDLAGLPVMPEVAKRSYARTGDSRLQLDHEPESEPASVSLLTNPDGSNWMLDMWKRQPSRENAQIRMSGLPVCERRLAYQRLLPEDDPNHLTYKNSQQSMWTDIGHLMHAKLQAKYAEAGVLWGHWKCLRCGDLWMYDFGPKKCCAATMVYEEVTVQHPTLPLTGHVDGVLRLWEGGKPVWAILELKTVGAKKLDKLTKPVHKHHAYQASGYAWLVRDNFNVPIQRIVYGYVSRDCPWQFTILYSKREGEFTEIFRHGYSGAVPAVKVFERKPEYTELETEFEKLAGVVKRLPVLQEVPGPETRICEDVNDDRFCPYRFLCFDKTPPPRSGPTKPRKDPPRRTARRVRDTGKCGKSRLPECP